MLPAEFLLTFWSESPRLVNWAHTATSIPAVYEASTAVGIFPSTGTVLCHLQYVCGHSISYLFVGGIFWSGCATTCSLHTETWYALGKDLAFNFSRYLWESIILNNSARTLAHMCFIPLHVGDMALFLTLTLEPIVIHVVTTGVTIIQRW